MNLRDFPTVADRRKALENELNVPLIHTGDYSLDDEVASSRHCENMIGVTQVPVGVAGSLQIRDQRSEIREYYIPLATTEGALVASVNRGCKALSLAAGAEVKVEKVGTTRAPVFVVKNMQAANEFVEWISKNFKDIKKKTEETSKHLELLKITPIHMGRNVFVRFYFDTQDAMGMNMATIAVGSVLPFIEEKTGSRCVALSGNLCVDKKANYANFIHGRGYKVWAEATIAENIVQDTLKTDIEKIVEVGQRKLMYGSALAGSLGFNAHYANVLSAIFLATGQDIAEVSECAMGITTVEKVDNGLYISVYLPDLMIGTVGGGTGLATQKEALSILGIDGGNKGKNAEKFAGIIGAAVLAGETSLLASLANNTLATAHEKLGRSQVKK